MSLPRSGRRPRPDSGRLPCTSTAPARLGLPPAPSALLPSTDSPGPLAARHPKMPTAQALLSHEPSRTGGWSFRTRSPSHGLWGRMLMRVPPASARPEPLARSADPLSARITPDLAHSCDPSSRAAQPWASPNLPHVPGLHHSSAVPGPLCGSSVWVSRPLLGSPTSAHHFPPHSRPRPLGSLAGTPLAQHLRPALPAPPRGDVNPLKRIMEDS